MDWQLAPAVEQALTGCRFSTDAMVQAISAALRDTDVTADLCSLIREQQL
jgi:hypothetical protein